MTQLTVGDGHGDENSLESNNIVYVHVEWIWISKMAIESKFVKQKIVRGKYKNTSISAGKSDLIFFHRLKFSTY